MVSCEAIRPRKKQVHLPARTNPDREISQECVELRSVRQGRSQMACAFDPRDGLSWGWERGVMVFQYSERV